jgi:uncharacterized protein (DUF4415 family)
LSDEQLATLRRVTPEEHARFKRIAAAGRVGRPPKRPQDKAIAVSMRFEPALLFALKQRAKETGAGGWQTYAKQLLRDALGILR